MLIIGAMGPKRATNLSRLSLDWVDGVGVLAVTFAYAALLHALALHSVWARGGLVPLLLAVPILRRRFFRVPARYVGSNATFAGTASALLVVLGALIGGGAGTVLALGVEEAEAVAPVLQPEAQLRTTGLEAEHATVEATRAGKRTQGMRTLAGVGALGLSMLLLGGWLDRTRRAA